MQEVVFALTLFVLAAGGGPAADVATADSHQAGLAAPLFAEAPRTACDTNGTELSHLMSPAPVKISEGLKYAQLQTVPVNGGGNCGCCPDLGCEIEDTGIQSGCAPGGSPCASCLGEETVHIKRCFCGPPPQGCLFCPLIDLEVFCS